MSTIALGSIVRTIAIGSIVRVRTGSKGRPFQGTVVRLYANGTDVGVKLNSIAGQEQFGTKAVRFGTDAVSLVY